ncbi:MAG: aminotransferase class I/II-fold pyridoxal phosphate-dependent enzyme [Gammaproteobacteria bacterium]|nr:aminotransferase class I/II-fold pyridoxal phosphate-dependent enzyme [Gammaproteobacteria bacterium]
MNKPADKQVSLRRDLSDPLPIPDAGIDKAIEIMRSGRLFRYGEFSGGASEVALLERDFAALLGRRYAAAFNSCGSAIFVALKCVGIQPGDSVLVNGFTLAPVPGAIEHAGAKPVFVECADECRIDLQDLESKAAGGARVLLMSHMRGHLADMDAVVAICERAGIVLVEDCAHTLGARWNGRLSGTFGSISCFSLQSFKHINAGEGGVLVTDDDDIAAQAILYSGSYMLYAQNGARPDLEVFERYKRDIPNLSLRMHELTAAVARPQLDLLASRVRQWARNYDLLARLLDEINEVQVAQRLRGEDYVGSSIQFRILSLAPGQICNVLDACGKRGVDIKWFGRNEAQGFTSTWRDWRYVCDPQDLSQTTRMLERLCDMRIPIDLDREEAGIIAQIISEEIAAHSA